jgi:hypothetical protein
MRGTYRAESQAHLRETLADALDDVEATAVEATEHENSEAARDINGDAAPHSAATVLRPISTCSRRPQYLIAALGVLTGFYSIVR